MTLNTATLPSTDDDENQRGPNGWLGPCDFVLTCFAMGEAIEAGAEQIVGLVTCLAVPLAGWLQQFSPRGRRGGKGGARHPAHDLLNYGASFTHPAYLAVDRGGLIIASLFSTRPTSPQLPGLQDTRGGLLQAWRGGCGWRLANVGAGGERGGAPRAKPMLQRSVTGLHRDRAARRTCPRN